MEPGFYWVSTDTMKREGAPPEVAELTGYDGKWLFTGISTPIETSAVIVLSERLIPPIY
jgi:hypothetical protein